MPTCSSSTLATHSRLTYTHTKQRAAIFKGKWRNSGSNLAILTRSLATMRTQCGAARRRKQGRKHLGYISLAIISIKTQNLFINWLGLGKKIYFSISINRFLKCGRFKIDSQRPRIYFFPYWGLAAVLRLLSLHLASATAGTHLKSGQHRTGNYRLSLDYQFKHASNVKPSPARALSEMSFTARTYKA